MPKLEEVRKVLNQKAEERNGVFFYSSRLTDFSRKEMEFHDLIQAEEVALHQLDSIRNRHYHDYFKKWLYRLPKDSVILEIGSGSGFDSVPLAQSGKQIIVSDISPESVKAVRSNLGLKDNVVYLVSDGQYLPMADQSIDAVFLTASLHHFSEEKKILDEIGRVVKKGGLVIFAMEPSRFMMSFTRLFANNKKLRIHEGHSEADETHPGYCLSDWRRVASGFKALKLKRVWLILGFLHYGLEAAYRLLGLKKRIKVPRIFEYVFLALDEIFLRIPVINSLNWHWIVVLKKS